MAERPTQQDDTHLQHVFYRGALLDSQLRDVEALAAVPPHLQLLLGPLQQIIQRLIVDLTVGRPAAVSNVAGPERCKALAAGFCRGSVDPSRGRGTSLWIPFWMSCTC